jgi:hypothetical protein
MCRYMRLAYPPYFKIKNVSHMMNAEKHLPFTIIFLKLFQRPRDKMTIHDALLLYVLLGYLISDIYIKIVITLCT